MSDEEVEKFEITDYDLENEFNMFRPRRNLSKNQQIYGKYNLFIIFNTVFNDNLSYKVYGLTIVTMKTDKVHREKLVNQRIIQPLLDL